MDTRKQSFVFYRGFLPAFEELPAEDCKALLISLAGYALDQREPGLSGTAKAFFAMMKPLIDANYKRWHNGLSGGRPKSNDNQEITDKEPGDNQEITKIKASNNQEQTKAQPNENEKENEKGISRDKSLSPDYANASTGERGLDSEKKSALGFELQSESETQTSKARKTSDPETDAAFNEFWELYPARNGKKLDKARARILFGRLAARARETVIVAVKHYAASGQIPKDPARFLQNDYWRNWIDAPEPEINKCAL